MSLRKKDDLVFQYSKDFPFYFSPNDIDRVKGNGISIQDSFPIIEGVYKCPDSEFCREGVQRF